jgi:hypothetical protein
VHAALDLDTGDRSETSCASSEPCHDAGLTLDQTRRVVNTHANLVEKLAELNHDDVRGAGSKWSTTGRTSNGWTPSPTTGRAPPPVGRSMPASCSPGPAPLIDNVLDKGTTALLFGMWGTAKTFIAFD